MLLQVQQSGIRQPYIALAAKVHLPNPEVIVIMLSGRVTWMITPIRLARYRKPIAGSC